MQDAHPIVPQSIPTVKSCHIPANSCFRYDEVTVSGDIIKWTPVIILSQVIQVTLCSNVAYNNRYQSTYID